MGGGNSGLNDHIVVLCLAFIKYKTQCLIQSCAACAGITYCAGNAQQL